MKTEYEFSVKKVPESWREAEDEAPTGDDTPLKRKRFVASIPDQNNFDFLSAFVAALAMGGIGSTVWYFLETRDGFSSPWLAPVLGILIAIAVRLGGGKGQPDARAALASVAYSLSLILVMYLVERYYLRQVWGDNEIVGGIERSLVRRRLSDPSTLLAWAVGFLATILTSYATRKRPAR